MEVETSVLSKVLKYPESVRQRFGDFHHFLVRILNLDESVNFWFDYCAEEHLL